MRKLPLVLILLVACGPSDTPNYTAPNANASIGLGISVGSNLQGNGSVGAPINLTSSTSIPGTDTSGAVSTGAITVTGTSTLAGINATSLGVSGASNLSTLGVSGSSTFAGVTASTLGVTGTSGFTGVTETSDVNTGPLTVSGTSALGDSTHDTSTGRDLSVGRNLVVTGTANITGLASIQVMSFGSPSLAGDLSSTAFMQSVNSLVLSITTNSLIEIGASDNTGSVLTGINSTGLPFGFTFKLCSSNSPADDGVLVLSNEDGNSTANDQFKIPDSGRVNNGQLSHFTMSPDVCQVLTLMPPNQSDLTNKKWMVDNAGTRTTQSIIQSLQAFPGYDTEHLAGTINDYGSLAQGGIGQATSVPGPRNGSSTSSGQNTTIAVASNGATLPQPTITVGATTRFTQQGKGATTLAAGSNGVSLPTPTINVATTTSFATSPPVIFVTTTNGPQQVTCAGPNTTTTFTNCSGGTGAMATGGAVVGTYFDLAIQSTANGFLDYRHVQCSGSTSTTLTGCGGGVGVLATGAAVVNNFICEAGSSCTFHDHTFVRAVTAGAGGVTMTGFEYTSNTFSSGLGPIKYFYNYGPDTITLKHQNAGSVAQNQFSFATASDFQLVANSGIWLIHSQQDSYWRTLTPAPYKAGQSIAIASDQTVSVSVASAACTADQAITNVTTGAVSTCGNVGGTLIGRQTFTTAGTATYTPTPGTKKVRVRAAGGGGSGASCHGTGTGICGSGGGASGAYYEAYIDCGGSCTGSGANGVTIGAGGATPTAGAINGNAGVDTTFTINGSAKIVRGGSSTGNVAQSCTSSASAQTSAAGRFAATSTSGDINVESQEGGDGWSTGTIATAGHGGNGYWGQGGASEVSGQGGAFLAHGFGAGGAGVFCSAAVADLSGSAGISGALIIEEYN